MPNINDVIHIENKPAHYHALYPFSVTLHVPGSYPLNPAEKAAIQDALVNAASKIRIIRGGECNFAWCEGGKIDWEREETMNTTPAALPVIQSAALNIRTAARDADNALECWDEEKWVDAVMWINNAIDQLESARAKITTHAFHN